MIESGLYQFIAQEPSISDIVGGRIFRVLMPEGARLPAIVFLKVTSPQLDSLDGDDPTKIRHYQFDCYTTFPDWQTCDILLENLASLLVPRADKSGITTTQSYYLPDGTFIQAARRHEDRDLPFEEGPQTYVYRQILEVEFTFVPAN